MDETKTIWYRWIADHAQYFVWLLFGLIAGLFSSALFHLNHLFDKPGEAVIAAFTVVLAIATIGLFGVTWKLADATQASVEHGRRASEAELRAYIKISKHRALDYKLEPGGLVRPCITLRNVGTTQANEVCIAIQAAYEPVGNADAIKLTASAGSPFSLAPGEKTSITADLPPLDDALITSISTGQQAIFLLAAVTYRDVFGYEHRTRMRASSIGVNKVRIDGSIQLEWYGEDNDLT